jgi:YHS domain-containing protein
MPYGEFERLAQPVVAEFASGPAVSSRATMLTDPVCGAIFEEFQAAGRSDLRGETYYFCSQSCKMEFDDNPDGYLQPR